MLPFLVCSNPAVFKMFQPPRKMFTCQLSQSFLKHSNVRRCRCPFLKGALLLFGCSIIVSMSFSMNSCSFGESTHLCGARESLSHQPEHSVSITRVERCRWRQNWRGEVHRALCGWCRCSEEGRCPDLRRRCCMAAPQTGGYSLHMLVEAEGKTGQGYS